MACGRKKKVANEGPPKPKGIKPWEIMKYADRKQKCLFYTGVTCSILAGCFMPCMALIAGQGLAVYDPGSTEDERDEGVRNLAIIASVVSGGLWLTSYFQYAWLQHLSESLAFTLRKKYLESLMR